MPHPSFSTGDLKMKNALTIVAAAAAAIFAQGVYAQASAPTRAEVKAETKAAPKAAAGENIPAAPDTKSNTTRMERKATTKEAVKEGDVPKAGENVSDKGAKTSKSTKTRAERKAQTKEDIKSGNTTPAGEGQAAPKK